MKKWITRIILHPVILSLFVTLAIVSFLPPALDAPSLIIFSPGGKIVLEKKLENAGNTTREFIMNLFKSGKTLFC